MVVLCGLGGIFAEIIKEKSLWFAPVGRQKIESELADSKIRKVLEKNKIKIEVLIEEIKKLSQLAAENEWIKELDINPMIFYKDKAPIAVDIKGIVKTK
jgi:acetyltransferase